MSPFRISLLDTSLSLNTISSADSGSWGPCLVLPPLALLHPLHQINRLFQADHITALLLSLFWYILEVKSKTWPSVNRMTTKVSLPVEASSPLANISILRANAMLSGAFICHSLPLHYVSFSLSQFVSQLFTLLEIKYFQKKSRPVMQVCLVYKLHQAIHLQCAHFCIYMLYSNF